MCEVERLKIEIDGLSFQNDEIQSEVEIYHTRAINFEKQRQLLERHADEKESTMRTYLKDIIDKFFRALIVSKPNANSKIQFNIYIDLLTSFLNMDDLEKDEFVKMLHTGKINERIKKSVVLQK